MNLLDVKNAEWQRKIEETIFKLLLNKRKVYNFSVYFFYAIW